ncbi:lysozyme-like protein [Rozella allomycis CSF55]|uniref:Lysozyme-like domain-containing protein n=1 Tax=Rozella allomycis (strain CSF55) TaxID=988480 RepID=A0A075AVS6_ROZAC|nr:Lysozyme-like domain-containing protein [Rozella allomycis CSF55]RKP17339.1 lysozyme-like protein [Rozella allomycis CSF55]|eukprot:EPZ34250.1 Lysozyme-like domain-containing protein [Rozella allomycis CSF55]
MILPFILLCISSLYCFSVSYGEFCDAITQNQGPHPTMEQYSSFVRSAEKFAISDKRELAMVLSQLLWESDRLRTKEEYGCDNNKCLNTYFDGIGDPSKAYHGRGYIQLTWGSNYLKASESLYGNRRLLENPDLVCNVDQIAWDVSFWFWKTVVQVQPGVTDGCFGASTKAINGNLECNGYNEKAVKRFLMYKIVFDTFNITGNPNESGCYN